MLTFGSMIRTCSSCGRDNRIPAARLDARARCAACKTPILPVAEPVAITTAADFDDLVRGSPLPVVVDFWADWCGPCKAVAPELKKLASSYAGRIVIAKVDTDALGDVAGRYAIRSIPTLIRFDRGRESKRVSGAQSASALAAALELPTGTSAQV
jgi:thioredoxin 2